MAGYDSRVGFVFNHPTALTFTDNVVTRLAPPLPLSYQRCFCFWLNVPFGDFAESSQSSYFSSQIVLLIFVKRNDSHLFFLVY